MSTRGALLRGAGRCAVLGAFASAFEAPDGPGFGYALDPDKIVARREL